MSGTPNRVRRPARDADAPANARENTVKQLKEKTPKMVTSIYLEVGMYGRIKQLAGKTGRSVQNIIRSGIERELERHE